jgi:hypothetical protein
VSKAALDKAVDCIFTDQGTADLLHSLFKAPDWKSGVTTHSLLLTLEDYLKDLKQWLDAPFYKRAVTVRPPHLPCATYCTSSSCCCLSSSRVCLHLL